MRRLSIETIASPPPGRSRLIASIFIVGFLLWQIALPILYYLNEDDSDERFAWRMFSVLSRFQKSCDVAVSEWATGRDTGASIKPPQQLDLQDSWSQLLARNRPAVVAKYLRARCQINPMASAVQFMQICSLPNGPRVPYEEIWFNCRTGALRRR
jgi:hypothetical protein